MSRRVYIETFGCQMNDVDSSRMRSILEKEDFLPVSSASEADLILLNTCSIREKADQKVHSRLGELRRWKNARQGRIVAVGGCLAQQEGKRLAARAPHVDLVFGTHNIARLPALLRETGTGRPRVEVDLTEDTSHWDVSPYLPAGASSAMVTIMQGCDNHCAYCVVPYVRGREISRGSGEILAEIRRLADRGVCEVILLGQNVNSYGKKEGEIPFPKLIRRISGVPGILRIRFVTSHPRDLDPETIGLLGELDNLCPHVHLPVQSGSDRILEAMGRGYTRAAYLRNVEALRNARPGIAFSSDFIVGFPGETEEDFADTLALMEEVRFDSSFSFRFSPRPFTRAASMPGIVPQELSGERLSRLQSLQDKHAREILSGCVGMETDVLVEGESPKDPGRLSGRTPCYKVVNFSPGRHAGGPVRRVTVQSSGTHSLSGVEGAPVD